MVRVGWHLMIKFDDGMWYRGEVMKIKERIDTSWLLDVQFEDGDSGTYDYPDNDCRLDVDSIHGISLYRLHMATCAPCMKAWFIYFLVKSHRLPEWQDCKVYLTNFRRFPIDEEYRLCRQTKVRNKVDVEKFEHVKDTWRKAKMNFEICLFKCTIDSLDANDDVGDAMTGGKEKKRKLRRRKLMKVFRCVQSCCKMELILKEMRIERELNKI